MFCLASLAFVATAVSGLVVPRTAPPAGWATKYLEAKQNAATALPSLCTSALSASLTSSAMTPTATDDVEEDCNDDGDDSDDGDESSSSVVVPSTPAVMTTSVPTQAPSPTITPVTSSKTSHTPSKTLSEARVQPTPASETHAGGFATYFYQNGVAGACGTVHKDTDFIAAIDEARYGNSGVRSSLCGKQVKITNPANKKVRETVIPQVSVVVTIADDCPTCNNANSIDLSKAAFQQIATLEQGMVGNWQKGDALHPESFAHLFPEVDGVVHTLGTLIENSNYKQAINRGDILGFLGSLRDSVVGNHGNPLERPTGETLRGSYDIMNRDSALRVCEAFVSSTSTQTRNIPRPFVYISAEDIFRPIIPARYIETKREAEQGIEALIEDKPDYRGVYIRPSLVYHAHHRPLTTPAAVLFDLSATLHAKIPHSLPTPSSVLRHVGARLRHENTSTSSLESIANALTTPPIHVDHVAMAVCAVLDSDNPVRGVIGVQQMRALVGWAEHRAQI
ncbi:hypothetical protein C0992_009048 [Termitomyces sp. T32_za158]|nr:hypothetical protein C0992_009048 [Termitomyces sp. T32_za158]